MLFSLKNSNRDRVKVSIQEINRYIATYQESLPKTEVFVLKTSQLTPEEIKTIRSSAVLFNLTSTTPRLCSLSIDPIHTSIGTRHELGLANKWLGLALYISAIALTLYGTYRYIHYVKHSYSEAVRKVNSGNYILYRVRVPGASFPGNRTPIRSARALDFMSVPFSIGFFGSMFSIVAVIKAKMVYNYAIEHAYKTETQVTINFEAEKRLLPETLANGKTEGQTALIDPISFDEIPLDRANCRCYVHLNNYVLEFSSCIKAILQKPLERDSAGMPRLSHPLDGQKYDLDSQFALDDEIEETLCLGIVDSDFFTQGFDRAIYQCWEEQLPQDREDRFLSLFDERVCAALPAFVSPSQEGV